MRWRGAHHRHALRRSGHEHLYSAQATHARSSLPKICYTSWIARLMHLLYETFSLQGKNGRLRLDWRRPTMVWTKWKLRVTCEIGVTKFSISGPDIDLDSISDLRRLTKRLESWNIIRA